MVVRVMETSKRIMGERAAGENYFRLSDLKWLL